jgi:hypothetical protein
LQRQDVRRRCDCHCADGVASDKPQFGRARRLICGRWYECATISRPRIHVNILILVERIAGDDTRICSSEPDYADNIDLQTLIININECPRAGSQLPAKPLAGPLGARPGFLVVCAASNLLIKRHFEPPALALAEA